MQFLIAAEKRYTVKKTVKKLKQKMTQQMLQLKHRKARRKLEETAKIPIQSSNNKIKRESKDTLSLFSAAVQEELWLNLQTYQTRSKNLQELAYRKIKEFLRLLKTKI